MLQYVCGNGRTGRGNPRDEHAGADGEDNGTDRELQCKAASGEDAGIAQHIHVRESVRADGGKGEVIPVPAACTAKATPGVRVHGLSAKHHSKGLLQRSGICLRYAERDRPLEGVQPIHGGQQVQLHRFLPYEKLQCHVIRRGDGKGAHR